MSAFEALSPPVRRRQDKVEQLSLGLQITGSATSANVVCTVNDPSFVFLKTQGVDQITPALALAGDSATYTTNPTDSSGIFQMLVQLNESVSRVVGATMHIRLASGGNEPVFLGSATGITALNQSIMLVANSGVALNAANTLDCTVVLQYETSIYRP